MTSSANKDSRNAGPKESTLAFIRQMARAYTNPFAAPKNHLPGFIMN